MNQYVVMGHPIHHSLSPRIHSYFAEETQQELSYTARCVPIDGFAQAVRTFMQSGGQGANVTLPFKEEAYRIADVRTQRAHAAGAANFLVFKNGKISADNTDGVGLVRDIENNLLHPIRGKRVLLIGAGGAARGALPALVEAGPCTLLVVNRSHRRVHDWLAAYSSQYAEVLRAMRLSPVALSFTELSGQCFDVVINATSASLKNDALPLPQGLYAPGALAYDMMYSASPTLFLQQSGAQGASRQIDGLGMLVEQAAESFFLWRGVRPPTQAIIARLRADLEKGTNS
jgi:shikimate dehydrogenase